MDGQAIFFLLPFCFLIIGSNGQYNADEIDPVTGALLATCTFYGDNTVDCAGRLRCHPRDVQDRINSASLDQVCPKELNQKSGTWDRDQVIPTSMIRGSGSGRVAQCKFYANHQEGKFACSGAHGDSWKGEYSGTMNSAFKLGLPLSSYGNSAYGGYDNNNNDRDQQYPRGRTSDDDSYGYNRRTTPYYGSSYDRYATTPYSSIYDRYPNRFTTQGYSNDRDNYNGGRYSTGLGYSDRDPSYGNSGPIGRDRYNTNIRQNQNPEGQTESEITMCTYTSDGNGVCRDCTETVNRQETDRDIRTTRHYTCRGVETPATWSAQSGLIPDKTPDRYTSRKTHVGTCIFRPNLGKFDCHGGSADGGCSMSSDGYGSSGSSSYGGGWGSSAQKCLTGEKWSGTYRGSVYNN